MTTAKKSSTVWWIGAAVVLGGLGWAAARKGGWLDKSPVAVVRGKKVERGTLEISVVQRGNLAARDPVSIVSEIEGNATIIFLIKEGTFVKKGDLVAELDSSTLLEKKLGQEISFQSADAAWKKAKAQYEIQESQNKSDIEAAERKLDFARIDLAKYENGDSTQLLEKAENQILLAQGEQEQASGTYKWSQELNKKGFVTTSELERDKLASMRAEVSRKQADRAKWLLQTYEAPRSKKEFEANVRETERGLERARLKAQAQIADVDANLKSTEAKLKLEREKLQKYEDQLGKTKIYAPAPGMVVYARQEGGGRMGGDSPMQEGTQVRERQELLQIPREGGMIVEASIHESVLKQVTVGAPCSIKVDAQPGKQFSGKVSFVALLADKGSWWANPNLRVYKTEIQLEGATSVSDDSFKELRPGMSCSVEIFAGRVDDSIIVPLQSIFVDKGETIAFVATEDRFERRVVKVGRSNEKLVEVASGLKEGEEVLLSAPPGFTPSGADETRKEGASGERGGMPGATRAPAAANAEGGAMPAMPAVHGESGPAGAAPAAGPGGEGMRGRGPRGDGTRPRGDGTGRRGGGERGSANRPTGEKPTGEKSEGGDKATTSEAPAGGEKPGGTAADSATGDAATRKGDGEHR